MRILTRTAVVSGLWIAAVAGCGGHDPAATAAAPVTHKAATPADPLAPLLVAAVPITKPGTPPIPVQVKFALKEHPEAGTPVELELVLIPTAGTLERMTGKVAGEEGLTVVSGGALPDTDKPLDGVPVHHALSIQAADDGIYVLTVDIEADAGGLASTQSFTIPVIAGKGMADLGGGTVSAPAVAGKPAAPAPAPAH